MRFDLKFLINQGLNYIIEYTIYYLIIRMKITLGTLIKLLEVHKISFYRLSKETNLLGLILCGK